MGNRFPVIGTSVGLRVLDKLGYMSALQQAVSGNYSNAVTAVVAGATPSNMMSAAGMGLVYGMVKNAVGPITLMKFGKKGYMTMF